MSDADKIIPESMKDEIERTSAGDAARMPCMFTPEEVALMESGAPPRKKRITQMAEWTRKEDFAALLHTAACAINDALHDGESKHGPGSWMRETVEEQFRHIEAHITQYQYGDRSEDHLTHIVCRAVIAYALRERGSEK